MITTQEGINDTIRSLEDGDYVLVDYIYKNASSKYGEISIIAGSTVFFIYDERMYPNVGVDGRPFTEYRSLRKLTTQEIFIAKLSGKIW